MMWALQVGGRGVLGGRDRGIRGHDRASEIAAGEEWSDEDAKSVVVERLL